MAAATQKRRQTNHQRRAQAAYDCVTKADNNIRQDYGRQALRLPALIHHCGLCQALAFLEAKAGGIPTSAHAQLLADLARVSELANSGAELADKARSADVRAYIRMTHEAIASAEWLKRYAEALGLTEEER